MSPRTRVLAAGVVVLAALGCAPKQRIPLDLGPGAVTVYVDGEPLEGSPPEIELRSDRAHVLYFKSAGYRSQRVVLRSAEIDGKPQLEPPSVQVRLRPATRAGRDLEIEVDDEQPPASR